MSYRGPMILVHANDPGPAGQATLEGIEAALAGPDLKLRPNMVARDEQGAVYFRFRPRVTPAEAYRLVIGAAGSARGGIDALVWVGPPGTTTFGDSSGMSAESLALIAGGTKTTCYSSLADVIQDGERLPVAGNIVIVLDHQGHPALSYRVMDVRILPFAALPEQFDPAIRGEAGIAAWRADHAEYFGRIGVFDPDMPIVCERFELARVLARPLDERTG